MATQEFYIRGASDTEARGPFNQEQLLSLAETGQVTAETLYYEAGTEQWAAIGANADLVAALFPEKKKLKIKAKEKIDTLNVQKEENAPITVENMLAAAEGRTYDTKDKRSPEIAQARAAKLGMLACIVLLALSAAALLLPFIDILSKGDVAKIIVQPFIYFGGVDFLLALLLVLGMVTVYPFVRFRAALGLGFFGFLYWTQGQPQVLLAVAAGCAGLYLSTVFLRYLPLGVAVGLGLAGMGGYAYFMLS